MKLLQLQHSGYYARYAGEIAAQVAEGEGFVVKSKNLNVLLSAWTDIQPQPWDFTLILGDFCPPPVQRILLQLFGQK